MEGWIRELALFNLGIDSKQRGSDLAAFKVRDGCHGNTRHRHAAKDTSLDTRKAAKLLSKREGWVPVCAHHSATGNHINPDRLANTALFPRATLDSRNTHSIA